MMVFIGTKTSPIFGQKNGYDYIEVDNLYEVFKNKGKHKDFLDS